MRGNLLLFGESMSVFMVAAEVGGKRVLGGALLVAVGAVHQLHLPVLRLPVPPAMQHQSAGNIDFMYALVQKETYYVSKN